MGLEDFIEKCYKTDNHMAREADNATNLNCRKFLERSGLMFSGIGDSIFAMAFISGGQSGLKINISSGANVSWMDNNSGIGNDASPRDICQRGLIAHNKAITEIEFLLEGSILSEEIIGALRAGKQKLQKNKNRANQK